MKRHTEEIDGGDHDLCNIQGVHYKTGKYIEVIINQDYIEAIKELDEIKGCNQVIAPGLVDIQINGYKGYDFNQKPLTKEEWRGVSSHLLDVGVTTFYPTIITNSIENLTKLFKENMKVLNNLNMCNGMVGGFHLEGPYLSKKDGPTGAHEKKYIKEQNREEMLKLQESAEGRIKIIPISAEWDGAIDFIKKASNENVKVAIGHTAANSNQIRNAVEAGAVLSTHLGNGAHVTLPRHPNYIWDQLAQSSLWASVISDGHHLPANLLKVFNKVKQEKMILISDSVALAGKEPGIYETAVGGEVTLTKDGKLHLKNSPNLLAGSAQNLLQGIQHSVIEGIINISDAINKASIYPASLMNLSVKEGLTVGAPSDLMLLD